MSIHKIILSMAIACTCYCAAVAQNGSVSTGGLASGSGGTVSYSVGLAVYQSYSSSIGAVSEGIQQAYAVNTASITNPTLAADISFFPNPTTDLLNLKIGFDKLDGLSYRLLDMNGRLLRSQNINSQISQLSLLEYPSAYYFLKIYQDNNELVTYKIAKN